MKELSDLTCLVVDYGSFISLADKLGESMKKVYYYSPFEEEFQGIKKCIIGDGLERVTRMDDFMEPKIFDEIDLVCVPDIGFGGLQRFMRRSGKAVWGSMGASDLELYRTRFLALMKKLDLPVIHSQKCVGLSELSEYLKTVENQWVKVNRYREDMETWHHQDYVHSQRILESLAMKFGGLKEKPVFVVQEDIPDAREIGYDGLTMDGQYPAFSFAGYEKKNELYLGSLLANDDLPEAVQEINEAMAGTFAEYGYRNFTATELRVIEDGTAYYIDPTMRMAGQTMEHQFETCSNLAELIWKGANGELIVPEFTHQFAAEATMHYTAGTSDEWKVLNIPEAVKQWTKLYHYCEADGLYHFPPHKTDEVGVICGVGDTIEEAISSLKENFEEIKDEPVSIKLSGFVDLLKEIREAEKQGIEFSDQKVPKPESALNV